MLRFALLVLLFAAPAAAQRVRSLDKGASPPASIDQLAWLAGSWTGTGMGAAVAETYSAPLGGRITGHFTMADGNGGVAFTELVDYVPLGTSIAYRVRHFGPDMAGWEDKSGAASEHALLAIEGKRMFFDGMTLDHSRPGALEFHIRIVDKAGRTRDLTYRYRRVR